MLAAEFPGLIQVNMPIVGTGGIAGRVPGSELRGVASHGTIQLPTT